MAALAESGAPVLTLAGESAFTQPDATVNVLSTEAAALTNQGRNVVVRTEKWPEAVAATHRLGAERVLALTGATRLITLGGDTSAAVSRQLGITESVVLEEIAPGLPSTMAPGARPLLLVLKSGSFGQPDFVRKAIEHLEQLGG